uniref:WD repeat-containing protein VIP3-like n=1 Tax=Erigeron canadensis TaxID=72917 RepID=UPI001CB955D0|nr:WD repeat-containing protein VIP3-like [Erigeron canadensis]
MEIDLKLNGELSFETPISVCSWNPKIPGGLVTGDFDGHVKVWNLLSKSKIEFQTLMKTERVDSFRSIVSIDIHPDGDTVAVSSSNGSVRVGSISKKRQIFYIFGEPHEEKGKTEEKVKPEAKGKGRGRKKQPKDEAPQPEDLPQPKDEAPQPEVLPQLEDKLEQPKDEALQSDYAIDQILFSPKGTHLAGAGGVSASIKIWNVNEWKKSDSNSHFDLLCTLTEEPLKCFKGIKNSNITSVAWNNSGDHVACGSMGGPIFVFDVPRKQLLHTLNCVTEPINSLAYSPIADKLLVSGSYDTCVRVHDLEKNEPFKLTGHLGSILSVEFCPKGKTIVSCSVDKTFKLWDVKERKLITTRTNLQNGVCGVQFLRAEDKETLLATISGDSMMISLYKFLETQPR